MTDTITRPPAPGEPAQPSPPPEERAQGITRLVLLVLGVAALGLVTELSIVFVVLAIIVIVFLHELGHFLTAKWAGMKVTEFFIGFGPRIWSFRRGETEYGLKAIPAGAYVKVIGMHNLEDVPPEDEPRTYRQKSYPRRMSVAVAGSTMHFLIALVCIYAVLVSGGTANGRLIDSRTPEEFDRATPWSIAEVVEGSAAEQAGLRPGDRVVAVDGEAIRGFLDIGDAVRPRPNEEVTLTVERDGERFDVATTLGTNPDAPPGSDDVGFLGIAPERDVEIVEYNLIESVPQSFEEFGTLSVESVKALGRFFSPSGLSNFGDQLADGGGGDGGGAASGGGGSSGGRDSSDDDRVISIVGATRLGAEVLEDGPRGFLLFLAMLNTFIGLFNLIPLLPLDGGHVAIATYERIRSRRGRRYFADVSKLMPLTYAVVMVLIVLGLTTLYLDLADPISLE